MVHEITAYSNLICFIEENKETLQLYTFLVL